MIVEDSRTAIEARSIAIKAREREREVIYRGKVYGGEHDTNTPGLPVR